jgi:hypothetical protein
MAKFEFRIADDDRKKLDIPGPEWLVLDTDWVRDQPAEYVIRWEGECGYSIEHALAQIGLTMPAKATLVLVWLARKQGGFDAGGRTDDGDPEAFDSLSHVRTMRVSLRAHKAVDADPPVGATSSQPSSTGDESGTS